MQITYKGDYYGDSLIVTAENVNIEEDAGERIYSKDENGKLYCSDRDVSPDSINMISQVLEDMIYYRKKEFDSSSVITQLFDKLPVDKKEHLLQKLNASI